jgi:hypothetical protein
VIELEFDTSCHIEAWEITDQVLRESIWTALSGSRAPTPRTL